MTSQTTEQLMDKSSVFIDKLAERLGTTGGDIYTIMIKYQIITGIASLLAIFIFLAGLMGSLYIFNKIMRKKGYDFGYRAAPMVIWGFGFILIGGAICVFIQRAIVQILSPEYSAIQFIISSNYGLN